MARPDPGMTAGAHPAWGSGDATVAVNQLRPAIAIGCPPSPALS